MVTLSYVSIAIALIVFIAIDYTIRKLLIKDYAALLERVSVLKDENTLLHKQETILTDAALVLSSRIRNLEVVESAWNKLIESEKYNDTN